MRPNLYILAATALLFVCAFIVIRTSGMNEEKLKKDLPNQVTHSSATRPATRALKAAMEEPAQRAKRITPKDEGSSQSDTPTTPVKPVSSIQLADDVQLPAVILALNAANENPDLAIAAPLAAMMHGIEDAFYQDLAAHVTGESGDNPLIRPGPEVDRARNRANESYRKVFGEQAFNKLMVHAAVEARLPVESDSSGN